jgi:hypothetical protein
MVKEDEDFLKIVAENKDGKWGKQYQESARIILSQRETPDTMTRKK